MKTKLTLLMLAIIVGLLAGCAHDQVTVADALQQLGSGMTRMRMAELSGLTNAIFVSRGQTNINNALYVSSASVTFNFTTSKNNSNELIIAVASSKSSPTGSIGDTYSSSSSVTRANQITVNFLSPLFSTTTTTTPQTNGPPITKVVQGITDPTNLAAFLDVVNAGAHHIDEAGVRDK